MRATDASLVRDLPLFSDMSDEHFEILMQAAFLQRFPAHVAMVHEGEQADFLHVVIEGAVEFFSTYGEHETTIWIGRPVSTFILAAVIRDEVYLNSVRTLEPSRILMIPAAPVRDIFDCDSGFARAVVRELAARYRIAVKDIKNLKLRSSLERLANWLLQTDIEHGGSGNVEIPFGKRTLAALMGITPENLSRNFAALSAYGVDVHGRKVTISDTAALKRLAKPVSLIDDPNS